ncbi:MAG: SCO family protein [Phycisphaerales bacterium]|nr:SCO family protein [Phycisphaerales bacterium]
MNLSSRSNMVLFAIVAMTMLVPRAAFGQLMKSREDIKQLNGVGFEENLGHFAPLDAEFTNAYGETVVLSKYFSDSKPVIFALVYYECPVVCPVVLDKLTECINELDYLAGEDFRVVVVSFDHTESTPNALGVKTGFVSEYERNDDPKTLDGFAFHTGDAVNIRKLADAVGYDFQQLDNGEYSHPVGLMVLSPKGKVTRYFYGFDYPAREMKLSLLDASEGKIAKSLGDRFLQFCYRIDPNAGVYTLQAMQIMKLGALLVMFVLFGAIGTMLLKEQIRKRRLGNVQSATGEIDMDSTNRANHSNGAHAGHVS